MQRPVRRRSAAADRAGIVRWLVDTTDRDNPARWNYQAPTSPGSRAHGLHWAAAWIEQRVTGEACGDLFARLGPAEAERVATVAARARRALERALGRDGRTTVLDRPCPWCTGELTGRTRAGGEPVVTCGTGPTCTAPVAYDERARRHWRGAELAGLYLALKAAAKREA